MKNLKIRTKLFALVVFMLVGLMAIGVASLLFMSQINQGSTEISQNWMPSVITAEELNTYTSDYRIQEYAHIIATDSAVMTAAEENLETISAEITRLFEAYKTNYITEETDGALIAEAETLWNQYLGFHDQMLTLSRNNKTEEALKIVQGDAQVAYDNASTTFLKLVQFNSTGCDAASAAGDALFATAQSLMIVVIIIIVVVSLAFALLVITAVTKPVKEIDTVAKKIAEGNLDASIHYQSKDELGVLAINFNKTVSRLRDYVNYIDEISAVLNEVANGNLMFNLQYDYAGEFAKVKVALENISASLNDTMGQINQTADQVASGSEQVSGGAQALSQGATEQASSVEELAATINEISGHIKQTAENANEASRNAETVGTEATESNKRMQDMLGAMSEISNSSSEIGKIIKTIEDIAFQTNILALNAAVEAARAGEAGKGFAVVADEVRNLASKSAEASKNTSALIENSLHAVGNGTKIADETAQSLSAVVKGVSDVSVTINKISQASNEQASSIAQVTQGVDQISSVVQNNSATAEESAAASEELSSQAQVLKGLVSKFKLKNEDSDYAQLG